MDLSINCKGISDANLIGTTSIDVELSDVDCNFINQISAKDIVVNFDDIEELLSEIDDDIIYKYLENQGLIANKM